MLVPKISVLIPTFNGERFIGAAVESVLSQGVDDLEVIVTDDNSSDGTADIVASQADPRIKFISNPTNLGAQGNWNLALSLATGRYVKLMPQDDLLRPGALAKQIAVLDADVNEEIAFVFGAREIIDANNRVIARRGISSRSSGRIAAKELVTSCVRFGTNRIGEPGAVLFRRSVSTHIGNFDGSEPYVIDLDYWFRLLTLGDAWYLAEPVSAFRISGGSWSIAIGKKQSAQFSAFLDRMQESKVINARGRDLRMGRVMAKCNNYLRLLIYCLVSA